MIASRTIDALKSIVETLFPTIPFLGLYRYRVVSMSFERAELQAVRKAAGLPDVLPVSMHPGVAGAWAKLAPGAVVLVAFIEGDVTQPIVTHFTPKGEGGFVPVELELDATSKVSLGASASTVDIGQALGAVNLGPALGTVVRYGDGVKLMAGQPPTPVATGQIVFDSTGSLPLQIVASPVKA